MIDYDERREVAARLRALDVHDWNDFMDEVDSLETAIGCSIGQDWQDQNWWHRLADLIEPPTCKNLATHLVDELVCSACGERVDIAYLDSEDDYRVRYCPGCGAKVMDNE